MAKEFEVTYTVKRKFTIPDTATDEEYDTMKDMVVAAIAKDGVQGDIKVKLTDAPDEIRQKYIINKDCQD